MSETVIFHNPRCSTSRDVLAMIRDAGNEPTVVEYLKTGWTRETLEAVLKAGDMTARDVLRTKEPAARDLLSASEGQLLDAMVADPILVERPIVQGPRGTVLARPKDRVLNVL